MRKHELNSLAGGGTEVVQSLVRGLSVIKAFSAEHSHMTLSEVARRTDLSRATARRVLYTLVALRYVESDGRMFRLCPRVLELGYAYLSSLDLPAAALPHLERLTAEVNESCSVAVLDNTEIVYVARVATRRIMTVAITVGTRFPAHLTSMGRVLLAGLAVDARTHLLDQVSFEARTSRSVISRKPLEAEIDLVAKQGWAMVDQELEEGLRSIAVPIRDANMRVVAAVNVSTSTRRGTPETVRSEVLPALQKAAIRIEADLAAVLRQP